MNDIHTSKAYAAFAKIAKQIESKNLDYQMTLASVGILPQDYRTFAIAYVAQTSGVMPNEGQRGLTFTKDSREDNRVKYIVRTLNGAADEAAAKRKASKVKTDLEKAIEAFEKLSAAERKAFMKAVA